MLRGDPSSVVDSPSLVAHKHSCSDIDERKREHQQNIDKRPCSKVRGLWAWSPECEHDSGNNVRDEGDCYGWAIINGTNQGNKERVVLLRRRVRPTHKNKMARQ